MASLYKSQIHLCIYVRVCTITLFINHMAVRAVHVEKHFNFRRTKGSPPRRIQIHTHTRFCVHSWTTNYPVNISSEHSLKTKYSFNFVLRNFGFDHIL